MFEFSGFEDWIPIFRGGKQIDSNGIEHDGDELIKKALAKFNAATHEPPAVIGHPADNAPAYGWVEDLKKGADNLGNLLLAKFKQVQPQFAQMVKDGLFKKRSASFYPDGSLRHVAFLGAAPPAVKGLADVAFNAEEAASFEFADDANKTGPAILQTARAKHWKIAVKDGGHVTKPGQWKDVPDEEFLDPVNYRYPCPDADQTRAAAAYWGRAKDQEQYSDEERTLISDRLKKLETKYGIGKNFKEDKKIMEDLIKKLNEFVDLFKSKKTDQEGQFSEADLQKAKDDAAKVERDKVTAEFAAQAKTTRLAGIKTEIATFCEGLLKQGKISAAAIKYGLADVLFAVATLDGDIEFGETKEKATLYARMKGLLESATPMIVFKEVATRGKDTSGTGTAGDKLDALTQAKMKDLKTLTYAAAFSEVQKEYRELALEYAEELKGNK